jgi:PAS domain S-box-containing protein
MFLKAGVFLVFVLVVGCLLAIFYWIPPERALSVLEVEERSAGSQAVRSENLTIEFLAGSDQVGGENYLRLKPKKAKKPARISFVTKLRAYPTDLLRVEWRARGEIEDLGLELTIGDQESTVFSRSLPSPKEDWRAVEIPLQSLRAGAGAEKTEVEPLKICDIALVLSPVSSLDFDLRRIELIQGFSRWEAVMAVLSAGGLLILAFLAAALVGRQVKAEVSMRRSDTYYRSIFNAVSEAIFVLDVRNGTVLDVNEKACQIFDRSREQFLEADVDGILAGTIKRDPLAWIKKALGGETERFEWRGKSAEGDDLWLEFNLRRSAIEGEEKLLAVVRDIGDEKRSEGERLRLEQQLLHSQKLEAIGQLAGGVAHDFNNILTSISCSSELALRELPTRSLPAAGFRQISELTQRATALTRQLLAFSRQQALRPSVHSVNQLVENAIKMLTRMIGEDVELDFRPAAEPDTVRADIGQIEQVLMNLAINARDAMPGGGTLTIETFNTVVDREHPADVEPGAFLKLSVTDSGQGMDQETRERIFEPFFTTKEVGKGTGLGLSTVYGIVRQHKGDILFDSQLGEGTVFHIFLPLVDEEAQAVDQQVDEVIPDGSETVLLVEDDPNAREIIERVLKAQGYKVYRAGSAREAKQLFDECGDEVDLLLTDIVMPGDNGVQLHRQLQEKNPLVKVLFMSGYTARSSLQNDVIRPGLPFIAKPFGPPELARKIREVLETGFELDPTGNAAEDSAQWKM